MTGPKTDLPDGWSKLDKDDRSSTVAWFVGGYEHENGVEVLIWKGVEQEDGSIIIETTNEQYERGKHTHVIEGMKDGELEGINFAESEEQAWEEANGFVRYTGELQEE